MRKGQPRPPMRLDLSADRVREVLNYEPESGVLTWRVPSATRVAVGQVAGYVDKRGYRHIRIDGRLYLAHRLAWLHVHGEWPREHVDHRNCDPGDNRLANLRQATNGENLRNRGAPKNNTSGGYPGVHWIEKIRTWRASVRSNGKTHYFGFYKTRKEAAAARDAGARELHGEFAYSCLKDSTHDNM